MDLVQELQAKKSIMIKGLFDPFVINSCPNLEYLSDPIINDSSQIQDLLAKRSARVLTKVEDGSASAAVILINDLLEEKRLKETPDLITCFYTLQEFAPWAHVTQYLVGGNLVLISKHAAYLPETWFPESFIQVLGKLLHYYSKVVRSVECLAIYRILYFAVKKNIRLNTNVIMESCQRVFLLDTSNNAPTNLLILLLAIKNASVDKDSERVFNLILDITNIYGGKLFSLESLDLLQIEFALVLQRISCNDWRNLTIAICHSFKDQGFDSYIWLIQTFKRYSDFVLNHRDSKWIVSQFLFQDEVIDSFVKNCEWIYDYIKKNHSKDELCALVCILFSLRAPFLDDLQGMEIRDITTFLHLLSDQKRSQTLIKDPNVSQEVCAFITSQLFHGKLFFPAGKMHAIALVKNCIQVLFDDCQLLRLPINFYQVLQESAKDTSLIKNDPMWALLRSRSKRAVILYASAGKIANASGYFCSYLCEINDYKQIDEIIKRIQNYSRELHDSFHSSAFVSSNFLSKPEYKTQMMDFWMFFQTIALCISLILRPISLDLPDSPSFAKEKSLPFISKILNILSNIHFITIRYGPTGFSLWRDIVDRCMIGLKLYPAFIPHIFESLNVSSSSSISFMLDVTKYLLPQLTESRLEPILHKTMLPKLGQLQKNTGKLGLYDQALQDSGFALTESLFKSPLKFKDILFNLRLKSVEKGLLSIICGITILSDPIKNKISSHEWNSTLQKFIKDTQDWIETQWNSHGSSAKTRLICRQLISSLEIIPSNHSKLVLTWIRESIATRKDYILPSIHDSLLREDQINHGKRPWLVYQFKSLL